MPKVTELARKSRALYKELGWKSPTHLEQSLLPGGRAINTQERNGGRSTKKTAELRCRVFLKRNEEKDATFIDYQGKLKLGKAEAEGSPYHERGFHWGADLKNSGQKKTTLKPGEMLVSWVNKPSSV